RIVASRSPSRLAETSCHSSYPLNSENASPPGTFTVYLSCAKLAVPPRTARDAETIPIASLPLSLMIAPFECYFHSLRREIVGAHRDRNSRRSLPSLLLHLGIGALSSSSRNSRNEASSSATHTIGVSRDLDEEAA